MKRSHAVLLCGIGSVFIFGCARLFGWDIHAPGLLSESFAHAVPPMEARVALYLPKSVSHYVSTARGGRFADPTTFHVGESYGPMAVEAFQHSFTEFIFLEAEPTAEILKRYGIRRLVAIEIKSLGNTMTLKGQALTLVTHAGIFDQDMNLVYEFESTGRSDARDVFRKKGGPEVNLSAAIERNILAVVQYVQDYVRGGGNV